MKTVAWPATALSGQLGGRDLRVDRRVVLDRALDRQVRAALADQRGRGGHLVDVGARAGRAGRVRQHRHPRLDAERGRGVGRLDSAMSASCGGVRVGVDRAVAVDQHPVGEQHEEHAGRDRDARHGLDDLERRPDRRRGGVGGAGDHAVGTVRCGPSWCRSRSARRRCRGPGRAVTPLWRAQLGVLDRELVAPLASLPGRRSRAAARSMPSSRARRAISSGWPSSVRSATPRRSRISAARRIRSSVPSGSTSRGAGPGPGRSGRTRTSAG